MASNEGTNASHDDNIIMSGFLCPECMQSFGDSNSLLHHFESSHKIEDKQEKPHSDVATAHEETDDSHNAPEHLLEELLAHNSRLSECVELSQGRISELEAVINLILNQSPLPEWIKINDVELKQKVNSYLDYQAQLASNASSSQHSHTLSAAQTVDFSVQISPEKIDKVVEVELCQPENVELVNELLKTNKELTDEQEKIKSDNVSLLEKVTLLQKEQTIKNSDLVEINQNLTNQLQNTQTELNERKLCVSVLEGQLNELRIKYQTLLDSNERTNANHSVVSAELDELKLNSVKNQIDCENEIKGLTDKLNKLSTNHTASQNDCENLQKENSILQNNLDESRGIIEEMQKELEIFHSRPQPEHTMSKQEVDSLLEKLISVEDENASLQKELQKKTHEAEELRTAMLELGRENQALQVLRERTVNRQWANDNDALNCSSCNREFSLSNRKHHCRNCGEIFCQNCSAYRAPIASSKDLVRVCQSCYKELTDNL